MTFVQFYSIKKLSK